MTMAAIAVGGSLISGMGNKAAANAQAKAAKAQAAAMRKQAALIRQKALINKGRMRVQGKTLSNDQVGAYAASGVDISSGSVLSTLNDTANQVEQQIDDMMVDSEYEATAVLAGASVAQKQGAQIKAAANWQMAGSLISAAGSSAKYF